MKNVSKIICVVGQIPELVLSSLPNKFNVINVNSLEETNFIYDELWYVEDKISNKEKRKFKNANLRIDKKLSYNKMLKGEAL